MTATLKIALAQCNFHVGDIPGNTAKIIEAAKKAADDGAQLIVFSELALTGYPPEDLLMRPSLEPRINEALREVAAVSHDIAIAIGYPVARDNRLY
ncbi:MAG: NAD+ synthase, partial [Thalassolituus maritimus]